MSLKKIMFICVFFILVSLLSGCQQNKEKEMISLTSYNALVALNDLSVDISKLLDHIEKQEYIESDKVILQLHETWDQLYPYVYVAGLEQSKGSAFNSDLNQISNMIFSESTKEKEAKVALEAQKADLYLRSVTGLTEMVSIQQSAESKQPSSSKDDSTNEKEKKDNNDLDMMDKNKVSYQSNSVTTGHSYENLKSIILPSEVRRDTYPEVNFNTEDAKVYIQAVQLTKHLADFYALISEGQDSKLIYMKYLLQDMKASAFLEDYNRYEQDLKLLQSIWDERMLDNGTDVDDLIIKITKNIQDIGTIASNANVDLIKVKCSIAIKNLEELMDK